MSKAKAKGKRTNITFKAKLPLSSKAPAKALTRQELAGQTGQFQYKLVVRDSLTFEEVYEFASHRPIPQDKIVAAVKAAKPHQGVYIKISQILTVKAPTPRWK